MPRQSSHSKASAASSPSSSRPPSQPPWLGLVKRAVVVMSVLIVLGLGLLVYGVVNQVGRLSSSGDSPAPASLFSQTSPLPSPLPSPPPDDVARILRIPRGLTLIASDIMADGRVMLSFAPKDANDANNASGSSEAGSSEGQIIILSPDWQSIVGRLRLVPDLGGVGNKGDFVLEDEDEASK